MKYRVSIILSSTIRNFYFAKAKSYASFFSFYVKIKRTQATDRGKPARFINICWGFCWGVSDIITESLTVDHSR